MVHKLHVYTGNGKGKTTAAVGMLVRAAGHSKACCLAQFLKNNHSGEITVLKQIGVTVYSIPSINGFYSQFSEKQKREYSIGVNQSIIQLEAFIEKEKPEIIVFDELCVAINYGVVQEDKARELINLSLLYGETIITGRFAAKWLINMVDYCAVMQCESHPFCTEHLNAREGIEW